MEETSPTPTVRGATDGEAQTMEGSERDAVGAQFFHTQICAMFCCLSLKVDLRDFLNAVSMASKHVIYTASVMDYIFVLLIIK